MTRLIGVLAVVAVLVTMYAATAADLPKGAPEEVGLSSERLVRIGTVLGAGIDRGEIPGFVALVARHGKIAYYEAFGVQDPKTGKKMARDAVFRIYSMTKPITSVAVMMLFEEGRLKLSDPIGQYLPELANLKAASNADTASDPSALVTEDASPPISVGDLLRHTSGITYEDIGDTLIEKMYMDTGINDRNITNAQLVTRLSHLPLKYQPGTIWDYGRSTDVLGRLVEVISGMSFGEFLQTRILEPLGMQDTAFFAPPEKLGRVAEPLTSDTDTYIDVTKPPLFEAGGEGLVSTVMDYVRFCQMMLNGGVLDGTRLLGRKTVELMTTDHIGDVVNRGLLSPWFGPNHGFGLGFGVRTAGARSPAYFASMQGSVGEYFWGGYAGTTFWIDPTEELIGIYMMQSIQNLAKYATSFKALVLQAVIE